MTDFAQLPTPAALVDLDRLEANLRRAAAYCQAHGLAWRPHAKTHKAVPVARRQRDHGAVGLTVATVHEAEAFAAVVDDLFVAYPPVGPARIARLLALPPHVRLAVGVDHPASLPPLAEAARRAGRRIEVLVELDVGMGRTGVAEDDELVALAQAVARTPGLVYRGLFFYPGHVRAALPDQGPELAALAARLDAAVGALQRAGLAPEVVSGGSTPTFPRSHELPHLTEVRPGINALFDRNSVLRGVASWDDVAYTVLATVVSVAGDRAVVDAGSKALAREEGVAPGYGVVLDHPEVVVRAVWEEHGVLDLRATSWRPRLGERVRIVPNHVCVSVHLQPRLWAVRGAEVEEAWEVVRGWP